MCTSLREVARRTGWLDKERPMQLNTREDKRHGAASRLFVSSRFFWCLCVLKRAPPRLGSTVNFQPSSHHQNDSRNFTLLVLLQPSTGNTSTDNTSRGCEHSNIRAVTDIQCLNTPPRKGLQGHPLRSVTTTRFCHKQTKSCSRDQYNLLTPTVLALPAHPLFVPTEAEKRDPQSDGKANFCSSGGDPFPRARKLQQSPRPSKSVTLALEAWPGWEEWGRQAQQASSWQLRG